MNTIQKLYCAFLGVVVVYAFILLMGVVSVCDGNYSHTCARVLGWSINVVKNLF
jgi:hypothetical protein